MQIKTLPNIRNQQPTTNKRREKNLNKPETETSLNMPR